MIFGRPTNLWLGAFTTIWNVIALIDGNISPEIYAAVNIAAGSVILLIASKPPTINSGDTVNVKSVNGGPTKVTTVHNNG